MAEEPTRPETPSEPSDPKPTFSAACFAAVGVCVWIACTGGLAVWASLFDVFPATTVVIALGPFAVVPAAWTAIAVASGRRRPTWLFLGVLLMVAPLLFVVAAQLLEVHDDHSSLRVHLSAEDYMFTSEHSMAPGTIVAFLGPLPEAPAGWMVLDGRSLPRREYPSLTRWIETLAGGDADTIRLPDYRGMFMGSSSSFGTRGMSSNVRLGPVPGTHPVRWLELHWLIRVR